MGSDWVLYFGLTSFGLIFIIAMICGFSQWNAWRRSSDGQQLIKDNTPSVFVVSTGYENAAFQLDPGD